MPSDAPAPRLGSAIPTVLAVASLIVPALAAQPLSPVGGQLQVNALTTSGQGLPDVASDAAGNFVVVWESFVSAGNDASARSIQARRYFASGVPAGAPFQVNTSTPGEQVDPVVASAPDGRFVVAWTSDEGGGGPVDLDIRVRRYAADGTAAGSDFLVNTFETGDQRHPDVAWAGDLGFAVVWESDDDATAGFDWNIVARLYQGSGAPATGELQVNSPTGSQLDPAIAGFADGSFAAAWESDESGGADTTTTSIQAAIVGSAEVQVNDHPPVGADDNPAIAWAADGTILVAWESQVSGADDDSLASIQGRRYDAEGNPGAVFQANAWTSDAQRFPSVAFDADGRFVVAWHSFGSAGGDASSASVQLRGFGGDGTPIGDELQANTYVTGDQRFASVAPGGDGLVVVWESFGSPGDDQDGSSVQARRFSLDLIFRGDFETGTFAGWSPVAP